MIMLDPGFEPGLPRPQRGVLTSRLIEHVCSGDTGFRSRCLALAKRALFQLSYTPALGHDTTRCMKGKNIALPEVGFEPTHPKITELKSAALDHSAIQACNVCIVCIVCLQSTRQLRDSNPRGQSPSDFESDALTTRPCCHMNDYTV